ncbi:MAG: hypothetical protein ABFD77_11480 [Thermotogota bacterium]
MFDYGGTARLVALRGVLRFAAGEAADVNGRRFQESVCVPVAYNVVGLYAFSHSGIAATNVLALYIADLGAVRSFIGRKNPTRSPSRTRTLGQRRRSRRQPVLQPRRVHADVDRDRLLDRLLVGGGRAPRVPG